MVFKRISRNGRCLDLIKVLEPDAEKKTPFDKGNFVKIERIKYENIGTCSPDCRASITTQYVNKSAFDVEISLMTETVETEYDEFRMRAIAFSEAVAEIIKTAAD